MSRRRQSGQSAVELIALLPAIVLLGLVVWQLAAAAHAAVLAGSAARAGARAAEVAAPVERAVTTALPRGYTRTHRMARVESGGRSQTVVSVRVPRVVPWVGRLVVRGVADVAP